MAYIENPYDIKKIAYTIIQIHSVLHEYKHLMLNFSMSTLFLFQYLALLPILMQTAVT